MAVTLDDVRHVAHLARLAIPEDQLGTYVAQLNGILGHMEVLQQVPSAGLAQAADASLDGMRTRADQTGAVRLEVPREQNAPAMRDGFFLVPRLATHEDSGEEA